MPSKWLVMDLLASENATLLGEMSSSQNGI